MAPAPPPSDAVLAYRARLAAFLGDRDPLEVLAATPGALAALVRDHGPERLRARPAPGKWSPLEVVGHLCDCEWVYGYRARLILCEDRPVIPGMDQNRWVEGQRHATGNPLELAETFRDLRAPNLRLWQALTPAELARTGLHAERGPESLGLLRTLLAGHDLLHLDQIRRLLGAG